MKIYNIISGFWFEVDHEEKWVQQLTWEHVFYDYNSRIIHISQPVLGWIVDKDNEFEAIFLVQCIYYPYTDEYEWYKSYELYIDREGNDELLPLLIGNLKWDETHSVFAFCSTSLTLQ